VRHEGLVTILELGDFIGMTEPTTDHLASSLPVTFADVERAAKTVEGAILNTDFDASRTLGEMVGADVWLKFENLQFTASFKERGALNKLASLTDAERKAGVIAMSAGNHAQGVAYHARCLGIPATIVMPAGTPTVKVENTRKLGAQVILQGATLEDAFKFALTYGIEHGLTFVHPYDDPHVIAGQGTVALEMLAAVPSLDTIIVPIGGGGLISGVAIAAKAIKPSIRIIGVEAQLYPSMLNAIKGSHFPVGGDTLAEGIAVKAPGKFTRQIIEALVDDIVVVPEADLERAVTLLITIEKTVVEGAGAAGLAALIMDPRRYKGHKIGLILCGGNIDTRLLASVLTRELARDGRLSRLAIDIPDRPGQLAQVTGVIGNAGANVVEVYHQRVFTDVPAKGTELNLVIETRDRNHLEATLAALRAAGYAVTAKGSASAAR
jgi:threonine dehydratase